METKNRTYFIVKVSAEDFLNVMTTLYGSTDTLRFEWIKSVCAGINSNGDAQLVGIKRVSVTETGISYETEFWDFYERQPELEEYAKIENLFCISNDMRGFTKGKLPLSSISVKYSELTEESNVPKPGTWVWLHYGDMD